MQKNRKSFYDVIGALLHVSMTMDLQASFAGKSWRWIWQAHINSNLNDKGVEHMDHSKAQHVEHLLSEQSTLSTARGAVPSTEQMKQHTCNSGSPRAHRAGTESLSTRTCRCRLMSPRLFHKTTKVKSPHMVIIFVVLWCFV